MALFQNIFKKEITTKNDELRYYKSIDFLPMWNYYKTQETEDLRYLLKLDDYESLPDVDESIFNEIWQEITYQVIDFNNETDRRSKRIFDKRKEIAMLNAKHKTIKMLLSALAHGPNESLMKDLADLGYRFVKNRPFELEWTRINKQSDGLLTQLKIKEADYNDMIPKGNNVVIESVIDSISDYKNRDINPHDITIKTWLVMCNKVNLEISKKQMKNG